MQSSQNYWSKTRTFEILKIYTGFVYRVAFKNLDSKLVRPSFYVSDLYYYNILNW